MDFFNPYVIEWCQLIARWVHVIAAIAWIGHAFFFNWLDARLTPLRGKKTGEDGVEGEIWLVHGGGFYQVEKKTVLPPDRIDELHWFYWESGITWLSGFILLLLVYYNGGGLMMMKPTQPPPLDGNGVRIFGLVALVVAFLAYDTLWKSKLGDDDKVAGPISLFGLFALIYAFHQYMSPRAAYIHVGAVLGTLMTSNVWMRIIPMHVKLCEAARGDGHFDEYLAKKAKQRSRHNNYMVYPLIFIMISNHFPLTTYSHEMNWVVLILLVLAGAGVRKMMNSRTGLDVVALAVALVAALSYFGLTKPKPPAPPKVGAVPAVHERSVG